MIEAREQGNCAEFNAMIEARSASKGSVRPIRLLGRRQN
jgi:hypothetical protein